MRNLLTICAILFLPAGISSAQAAQDSTVVERNAPIRAEPTSGAKVLEYLPMGVEVRISSYPVGEGWYKIRSSSGVYGWIHEKYLSVFKPNPEAPHPEDRVYHPERDRKFSLRLLGGFDFFTPGDLNTLFGFSSLNTGYFFGGEFTMALNSRFALALRMDGLFKDLVAQNSQTGGTFSLSIRSYPLMGGFDFYFAKLPAIRVSGGLFGGIAFSTSFSSTETGQPNPNTVVLQSSPFTALARVNVTRPLGRVLSVFVEAGYRYLRTSAIDTSSAANVNGGPDVFAQGGVLKARVIDLSGAEIGAGLGLHF